MHTRVSEQLSEDIRRFAEDLRVPASNLVRNVLEEVFAVVDGVSEDMGGLFDDLLSEAEGVRDRIRPDARAGRRARRGRRRSGAGAFDVEEELRRDEAREAREAGASDAFTERAEAAGSAATEGAHDGSGAGADAAAEEDPRTAAELFPEVLGWQPLVLNRAFECGRCQRALRPGESAFLGLGSAGLTEIALCGRCAGNR